jgi:NAD(P)-dependent dehydrogenase (short-subunit alcohol dehydrogenase family)
MTVKGKIAVVTGSSRGIGKAVADALAAAGAVVEGASRSQGTDVTREADVVRFFGEVAKRHGGVDILVNNAGTLTPRKPLVEVTKDEWDASIAGNLTGVFLCTREALRAMRARGGGLIVNIASGVSNRAAPTWGPYAAAKWGVEGLARLVAEEEKEHGIRVVSINPARSRTAMRAEAYPEEDPATVKTPEETARFVLAVIEGKVPFSSGDLVQYSAEI